MNVKKDVIVVGAGIVGICCALKLQLQGRRVTLIDKDDPASGCSKGNAGHFATEQIFPLSSKAVLAQLPSMLLNPNGPLSLKPAYFPQALPWLIRFLLCARKSVFDRGTSALTRLNKHAMEAYQPLIQAANATSLIKDNGYILTFEGDKALNNAEKESQRLKPFGIEHDILNRKKLLELEPTLKNCNAGLFFPDIYYTSEPYLFARSLFDCFIKNGGHFLKTDIHSIHSQADSEIILVGKNLNSGTDEKYRCQKIVISAGIFSRELVKSLGHHVPLDTERGYHLMLNQLGLVSRPVAFAERKFIITPMTSGTRLAGTVEFAGTRTPPNWKRSNMLLTHAKAILKGVKEDEAGEKWMGFRPSFPDSLPVIDSDVTNPNIVFAFGHQHLGLTQAAITADLVQSLIEMEEPKIDLSPFSIRRF